MNDKTDDTQSISDDDYQPYYAYLIFIRFIDVSVQLALTLLDEDLSFPIVQNNNCWGFGECNTINYNIYNLGNITLIDKP